MATQPDDEAFEKEFGSYRPAATSVPIQTIKPIIGGETPEEAAARRAQEAREARGGELAEEAAARAARGEAREVESKEFTQIGALRTEFLGNSEVKEFRQIRNATRQIIDLTSKGTPMANIGAVFSYMKILDPGSTVREGEAASAQNAAGVPDRIRNYYNQLIAGERLSPEQRADMARTAISIYNTRKVGYDDLANTYRGLMGNLGANPDEQGITLAPALQFGAEPEAAAAPGAASEPGAPRLQVAKGEAFSTEADFKRRQDSAEAWAATQGLPFEQALAKFNADMIARGYTAASPETISVLQWYEQNRPGDRGAVQWELPVTGVREGGAPGRLEAAGSALLTGYTGGLAEEIVQQFSPEAAAKSQIKSLIEQNKGEIAKLVPRHLNPDRMMKVAQQAATTTPALLECYVPTFIGAMIQLSQLGLEPNTILGHAYMIPFNNRRANRKDVQVIIGYKGLIELARRSGKVVSLSAHAVYERDEFEFEYGLNEKLRHVPAFGERGNITFFYAVAHLKDGGHAFEVMTADEVRSIRAKSQGRSNSVWDDYFEEMGRKTVVS